MKTLRKEIVINAPAEKVWAHLTDPAKIATWFMPADIAPRSGHRFTVQGETCGVIQCVVREAVAPRRLSYTFDLPKWGLETLVTFTLEESAGVTKLILVQTATKELTPEQDEHFDLFDGGWGTFLARLGPQVAPVS